MGPYPAGAIPFNWHHASLTVIELDVSIAFYQSAFGFELMFQEKGMSGQIQSMTGLPGLSCDLAQLRSDRPGMILELVAFNNVAAGREGNAPTSLGGGHVAFLVDDLDLAQRRCAELGATLLGEITDFASSRAAYFREPGGSFFELEEPRRNPAEAGA
jgi:catechol 2,3-dioxygenase-like lactoylglutathione lyase family enzyme